MNRTMISASVSLNALQQRLDMIANNIANMDTDGYKRREASFQDVLTSTLRQHPDMELDGRRTPLGLTVGGGARLSGQRLDLTQGALKQTDHHLDLAIEGQALFEVAVPLFDAAGEPVPGPDGGQAMELLYTRSGRFQYAAMAGMDGSKVLTTAEGYPVRTIDGGFIAIPEYAEVQIDGAGRVTYTDGDGNIVPAGQIRLMRVMRPDLIEAIGDNMYRIAADVENPGAVLQQADPAGVEREGIAVRQFYAEQSNVDLISEMTELIMVQRAYQLNARALSTGETMMNLANQLRR